MAKRSKKKKKMTKEESNELVSKIHGLRVMLKFTLRAIDGKYESIDDLFTQQAARIRNELEKLERNQ